VALLKSLKSIYENSNFYKEARIVSFVDRLLECIKKKLVKKFGLSQAVSMGLKDQENFKEQIEQGKNIIAKFKDNFFILELMNEQSEGNKVENFFGVAKEEEKKYDENSEQNQVMSQSFYQKEGLDFLYFNRPGTAYGSFGTT
jgi:hypothetical protein